MTICYFIYGIVILLVNFLLYALVIYDRPIPIIRVEHLQKVEEKCSS